MAKQQTLRDSFVLKSKGLHTGLNITATFCPAEVNYGYKIQRTDLEGQPIIDCSASIVGDTQRGTVLVSGDIKVSTIEHAMAALRAMGVDNCLVQLDGPEMPILDGSSFYFVQYINKVGVIEQDADREYLVIDKKIEVKGDNGEVMTIEPYDGFCIDATIAFDSPNLSHQTTMLNSLDEFEANFASARTFVFVRDVEPLIQMGLIRGGDLDNAIVIYEREMSQERYDKLADTLGIPHQDAHQLGYINHKPLTWPNECARHKLLDIIGDLALVGKPIKGKVTAFKPGHTINNKFARAILLNK